MFYWEGGRKTGALLFGAGLIWGHYLYFQRLWAHSKPHPLSSPKFGRGGAKGGGVCKEVCSEQKRTKTGKKVKRGNRPLPPLGTSPNLGKKASGICTLRAELYGGIASAVVTKSATYSVDYRSCECLSFN